MILKTLAALELDSDLLLRVSTAGEN